ncbi:MAG: T9SS type A sorting domain-containing protein [Candidatus Delongbacteria bacterium]|nr:T9SS type A sorting domain-containing protein [Candidatus Delongbacteria bacterium]MCG2761469.1 T9SS type A sorting domain-containing protein [Candidatus Delongbacteria bacterium]
MLKRIIFMLTFMCCLFYGNSLYSQYYGTISQTFDKSSGPYGWFFGYNRKIQTNFDPATGEMVGSLYSKLNPTYGNGTIGGMLGAWDYSSLSWFCESVYTSSVYQSEGNLPGGRYPYVSEFINSYCFCLFNDYDTATVETVSQPMFTVADAWGYNYTTWSNPTRIESSDSASVIPNAWNGTGDVVYDPSTFYYYWTQGWKEGLNGLVSPVSCVVGKTQAPCDPGSWEWSDYKELRFDTDNIIYKYSDVSLIGPLHFSYAKDTAGNGTGKGIGVAVTQCYPWYAPQLSYIYTNNWGLDWNKTGLGFHHQPVSELFDWVGESLTLRDSIGYSLDSLEVINGTSVITIDYPRIMWDISVVTTEENIVHVLCMVFPASSEYPNCIFPWTDSGFRAGYYDIRGEITDTGVNWQNAVFIANPVDNDKGWYSDYNAGMEFTGDKNRTLSLSYAGNNNILAAWLDKPESRYYLFDYINTPKYYNFIDDGYLIVSLDGGNSWEHEKIIDIETGNPDDPIRQLKYAANVTKTSTIFEEGWTVSSHGSITYGTKEAYKIYTYAACQYPDEVAVIGMYYMDYQRFLKVWDIGYYTDGIETEEASLNTDFELYQNYPNPFNPATEIKFSLAEDSKVNLSVYNTNGQLVKTLIDEKKEKGLHTVNFDASDLNSGMYFYKLDVNGNVQAKKMIMLK